MTEKTLAFMTGKRAILAVGAGDATGGAIARRFAREGFIACVTRRTADKVAPLVEKIRAEGGEAHGFGSDARKEEDARENARHGQGRVGVTGLMAHDGEPEIRRITYHRFTCYAIAAPPRKEFLGLPFDSLSALGRGLG